MSDLCAEQNHSCCALWHPQGWNLTAPSTNPQWIPWDSRAMTVSTWVCQGKRKWLENTTTSSLWSEYSHVMGNRKAHQLTEWRKEILSRNMMLVKKWFVIWATGSISGPCFWLCVETQAGHLDMCPKRWPISLIFGTQIELLHTDIPLLFRLV